MGWARFDDQYSDHPKVVKAGPMAELLDMRAVIYCARYETDGWLTREALARLGAGIPKVAQKAKALVESGRWHAADHACFDCPEVLGDGFYVHNFLKYNPSSEAKETDREAARERMRRARQGKRAPRSSGEHRPNTGRSSDNPVPVPSPMNSLEGELHGECADPERPPLDVDAQIHAHRWAAQVTPDEVDEAIHVLRSEKIPDCILLEALAGAEAFPSKWKTQARKLHLERRPVVHQRVNCPDCGRSGMVINEQKLAVPCPTCRPVANGATQPREATA